MTEPAGAPHAVVVAPAGLRFREIGRGLEVRHDLLHGAFRDPDPFSDVSQPSVRIQVQTHQDVAMIAQERPALGHRRILGGLLIEGAANGPRRARLATLRVG